MNHTAAAILDLDRDGVIEIATVEQAAALAAHLVDSGRDRPIVVVSAQPGIGWAIDADEVYDAVTPLARVARIGTSRVGYALSESMPDGTAVYGSAGRVYPTGTTWTSDPQAAPLMVARGPHRAGPIGQALAEAALAAGYTSTAGRNCGCDQTKALDARVRDLQRHIARLENRLARASAEPAASPQRQPVPIADPEARFRAEVTTQWQQRIGATGPNCAPLPNHYPLDPRFLASLEQLTPGQYRKAASVAMEILTGLVHEIPGRNVHRLRTGTSGNNPDRRTDTGQFILRANLQTNAPAARRIHWTLESDGRIALMAVTQHDEHLAA